MIDKLFDFLLSFEKLSYLISFLILVVCGLGIPIPEDITLIAGGILVSYKVTDFWVTFFVSMAGILCGDSVVYILGRYFGDKIIKTKFFSRMIKVKYIDMVERALNRYGNYMVFFARFLPGLRMPIYFSLGTFRKSFISFIVIDGLAAIISVPLWIYRHGFREKSPFA